MSLLLFLAAGFLIVFLLFSVLPFLLPILLVMFLASLIFRPRVHVVTRTFTMNPADQNPFGSRNNQALPESASLDHDVIDAEYTETYTD